MPSKATRPKRRLLWLQGVTCNGNSHSFLNHPQLESVLDSFEILYHPHLPCSRTLSEIVTCKDSCDVLLLEGAFDPQMQRAGVTLETLFLHYGAQASHVIAVGSCASFGGIFAATGGAQSGGIGYLGEKALDRLEMFTSRLINLSGCPIHPEWLGFVLQSIAGAQPVGVDSLHRPKALYAHLVHHGCLRNEYFEWKVDAKGFGLKEGCLFYDYGCRGPMAHGSCNRILWNDVASKTRTGQPCFGCTEPDFPRSNMFETRKNMSIPNDVPLGVSKRSYLTLTGIAKTFNIPRLEKRLIDD